MLGFQFFGFEIPAVAVVALVVLALFVRVLKLAFGGRGGHAVPPAVGYHGAHDHLPSFHGKDIRVRKTIEWGVLCVLTMSVFQFRIDTWLVSAFDLHGIGLIVALSILFFLWLQSLTTIQLGKNEKGETFPQVALPAVLGRPLRGYKPIEPGLHSFLFRGLYHGYITMRSGVIELNIPEMQFTTPDGVRLTMPVSIAFTPRDFYTVWFNEGIQGVGDKLTEMVEQRVREWGRSSDDGPQTWAEAQAADAEAVAVILETILGSSLPDIKSDIPALALKRYFDGLHPTTAQAARWNSTDATGKVVEWGKVKDRLAPLSVSELEELKAQLKLRFAEIEKCRNNQGRFELKPLGIEINRLNLGEIKLVNPAVADDAEKQAREIAQRAAEKTEWEGVCDRVRDALGLAPGAPLAFGTPPVDNAFNRFQAERGKLTYMKLDAPPGTVAVVNPAVAAAATTPPVK